MKDINLKYLEDNFLTVREVAVKSGGSVEEIKNSIEAGLLPKPSYLIEKTITITSPLADKYEIKEEVEYFPKSYSKLVKELSKPQIGEAKEAFLSKIRDHLLAHPARKFAYGNAVEQRG